MKEKERESPKVFDGTQEERTEFSYFSNHFIYIDGRGHRRDDSIKVPIYKVGAKELGPAGSFFFFFSPKKIRDETG
jgi:hypothetical protein